MTGEDDLPLSPTADAPPPSPELLARLSGLRPVRPRAPRRSWLLALLASAAITASGLALFRLRPDLAHLPIAWVIAAGLVWLAAAALPLWFTLVPTRGQVLPDARRALLAGLAALALVLLLSFFFTADAPGHSRPV
ncbi:MAG TPA: hypothetical protein VMZ28_10605, partial [Kofleriaceae bacterium]|nr:hypothetical protein [Kofleriaceae bacterium]